MNPPMDESLQTSGEPAIRVMCVEDHALVRDGITLILNAQPDMAVVASAGSGEEALELYREHRPNVILMDLQLPGMTGLQTIGAIREQDADARIIVLTMYDGDQDIYRSLQAGAVTYVLKGVPSSELVRVVREVQAGRRPMSAAVSTRLAEHVTDPRLTPREMDVLRVMARGSRNKEIASELGISDETVQGHVKSILAKLNVNDRTAAVTVGLRRGIIHLE
jgi:DNA-binding NarL/FixJ family response regulator